MGASAPSAPEPDYASMASDYTQWSTDARTRYEEDLEGVDAEYAGARARLASSGVKEGTPGYDLAMQGAADKRTGIEEAYAEEIKELQGGPTYETLQGKFKQDMHFGTMQKWMSENPSDARLFVAGSASGETTPESRTGKFHFLADPTGTPWEEDMNTAMAEEGAFEKWMSGLITPVEEGEGAPAEGEDEEAAERAKAAASGNRALAGGAFSTMNPNVGMI